MKATILLCLALLVSAPVWANPVSQTDVLATATAWLETCFNHVYTIKNFEVISDSLSNPLLYQIDYLPDGFVVISADDRTYPILGYASEGSITNVTDADVIILLQSYQNIVATSIAQNCTNVITSANWIDIRNRVQSNRTTLEIPMGNSWNNLGPFNDDCPGGDPTNHYPVGTIALAFSQITNYHKFWQYQFSNADDYISNYQNCTIHIDDDASLNYFPNFTTLNQRMNIVANEYAQNNALTPAEKADLCFSNGILMHMKYSTWASTTTFANEALNAYSKLNYHRTYASRSANSTQNWTTMMINDLTAQHPIHYI
jgi:hypothetical protein